MSDDKNLFINLVFTMMDKIEGKRTTISITLSREIQIRLQDISSFSIHQVNGRLAYAIFIYLVLSLKVNAP